MSAPRAGFTVLLLHAFPLDAGMWDETRRELGQDITTAAPTLPPEGGGRTLSGWAEAILGLVGYLCILASSFVRGEVGAVIGGALTLIGFPFAMALLYVQVGIIEAICQWCVASDAVITVLLVLAVLRLVAARRVTAESPV